MTVSRYTVLQCPLCEARRAIPAAEAESDGLVRIVAAHLLSAHPGTEPTADAPVMDRILDDPATCDSEAPLEELGWTTEPFPTEEDGESVDSADRSNGSESGDPFDDLIGR